MIKNKSTLLKIFAKIDPIRSKGSSRHMSCRLSVSLRSLAFLAFFAMTASFPQAAIADGGLTNSHSISVQTVFPILGITNVFVNGAGELLDAKQISTRECPFEDDGKDPAVAAQKLAMYQAASSAAKQAGDPDGCPYAVNGLEHIYLSSCGLYYKNMSVASIGPGAAEHAYPNNNILGCDEPPGVRAEKLRSYSLSNKTNLIARRAGLIIAHVKSDDPILQNYSIRKQMDDADAKKKEAEKTCYDDSLNRIETFWAQKQEVQCYKTVKNMITNWSKNKMFELTNHTMDQVSSDTAATDVSGAATAVTSFPAPWGLAKGAAKIAKLAVDIAKIANDASNMLQTLNQGCAGVISGLQATQNFEKSLSALSCQGLSNLVERQLTQCIRVNIGFDVSLPQFALLTQCPVNVSLSARLSPSGFNCYGSASATSPASGYFGGKSALSTSGSGSGLRSLFDGGCFKSSTDTSSSGGFDASATSDTAGTRVPGVDCGPLDTTTTAKNQSIAGLTYLQAGTGTTGWTVGGSETVGGTTITRCDYYESKRLLRTAYVYGSGGSCNAGASGFLDGGYETNTACYGTYTPASLPNVPDACLYPVACLNSSGTYNAALVGTNGCPTNVKPVFNANAAYTVFTAGGISGGEQVTNSCSDFNGQYQAPVQCCDPQVQNCANADANIPLCVCDQGDAQNTILRDSTGKLDAAGTCTEGGKVTCCSPRLNGQDWCEKNMGAASICADEQADQCVASGTSATYTGPGGSSQTITAADLVASKPSPYIYLFIRPDAQMNGQYCCMTEWCNVCPQHYANAYGLSLVRSNLSQATSDAGNNALIGRGWPFVANNSETNAVGGVSSYATGVNPLTLMLNTGSGDSQIPFTFSYPLMSMDNSIDNKPLDAALSACNNLSQYKVQYSDFSTLSGGNGMLGFVQDFYKNNNSKNEYRLYSPVPSMQETPLAYMNRIRSSMSSGGVALPAVPLCSDTVKICYSSSALTSDLSKTNTVTSPAPAVVVTPTVNTTTTPAVVTTPTATTTTTTGGSGGATEVPSAGTGQASPSLY